MPAPVTVTEARAAAAKKYDRYAGSWAVERFPAPAFSMPLHPPTERAALADQAASIAWARSWHGIEGAEWRERQWASLGRQSLPERMVLETAGEVASFAGRARHWHLASQRAARIIAQLPPNPDLSDAVIRSVGALVALDDTDFGRLLGVLAWLVQHPESGLYIRQLPIRGVDSKWVERNQVLVERLHTAATGRRGLGLATKPDLIRLRFLDQSFAPGGLVDVSAPVPEVAAMRIRPATVFVFENLESLFAMPPWADAVVVHGSGYAVDRLGQLPWVRDADIVYWGDLDSHGFAILNRLRSQSLPVRTVLMDVATLEEYLDLAVPEPRPATGELQHLTSNEHAVVTALSERGNARLEQERIPWEHSLAALRAATHSSPLNAEG